MIENLKNLPMQLILTKLCYINDKLFILSHPHNSHALISESSPGHAGAGNGVFQKGLGSQLMLQEAMQQSALAMVRDTANKLLNEDEVAAVMRHIKRVSHAWYTTTTVVRSSAIWVLNRGCSGEGGGGNCPLNILPTKKVKELRNNNIEINQCIAIRLKIGSK